MKLNLTPRNIYGSIQYQDRYNKITASQINGKWYPTVETTMFDAGFSNIACMSSFLENLDQHSEDLELLGYRQEGSSFINDTDPNFKSEITVQDDGLLKVKSVLQTEDGTLKQEYTSNEFDNIIYHIIKLLDIAKIDIFASSILIAPEDAKYVIEAKMTSRDLSKNLVRVKSSNIWAYGINMRDKRIGDAIIQFKNKNGGPGDLYQYLDVDVKTWRKLLSASSKGHAFWQLIRNKFRYRKLTGDKRGKLPNAVN